MHFPNSQIELKKIRSYKYKYVAGCDEVGMGPLAGPVVAAICILKNADLLKKRTVKQWFARVRDSKTIPEKERAVLEKLIKENCLDFAIGQASVGEIDKLNIHQARFLAMRRAWRSLVNKNPEYKECKVVVLVDGKFKIPDLEVEQETFVKGDAKILSIAAASIIAKNFRDRKMIKLHAKHPEYSLAENKGYGTAKHIAAIKKFGTTTVHRKSFLKNII